MKYLFLYYLLLSKIAFSQETFVQIDNSLQKTDSLSYEFFFESNVYKLTNKQKEKVSKILRANSKKNIYKIEITGFTDKIGNKNNNLILSENRAEEIKSHFSLLNKDLEKSITTFAKGEIEGKYENELQKNRKVDVKIFFLITNLEQILLTKDFTEIEIGEKMVFNNILFEGNKAILLQESIPELKRLKDYLLKNKNYCVEIQGHVDGKDWAGDFSLTLSNKRAITVHDYLVNNGISSDNLSYKGFGGNYPIAKGKNSHLNRRVEILRLDCSTNKKNKYLTTLYFKSQSTTLTRISLNLLLELIKDLKKNEKNKILIEGHTCCDIAEPEPLSLKRAKFINDYLVKKGISADRFKIIGLGTKKLLFNDNKNHKKNRRVEIYSIY